MYKIHPSKMKNPTLADANKECQEGVDFAIHYITTWVPTTSPLFCTCNISHLKKKDQLNPLSCVLGIKIEQKMPDLGEFG